MRLGEWYKSRPAWLKNAFLFTLCGFIIDVILVFCYLFLSVRAEWIVAYFVMPIIIFCQGGLDCLENFERIFPLSLLIEITIHLSVYFLIGAGFGSMITKFRPKKGRV